VMLPAFQFKVGHQIHPKFVAYGTCSSFNISCHLTNSLSLSLDEDGRPSLAMGTTGGKILLHSPHEAGDENGEMPHVRFLNFNKKITSLCSGKNLINSLSLSLSPSLLSSSFQ
jgi:hypothetical protein